MSKIDELIKDLDTKDMVISKLSDPETLCTVDNFIPSGCLTLDLALGFARGRDGYPIRRIVEVYGDNSTGKTILAVYAMIAMQEMGGLVVYADVEAALDKEWLANLGVNVDEVIYFSPDTIGKVFGKLKEVIEVKNKHYGLDVPMLFVWDSVAASATKEEMEKTAKDGWDGKMYPTGAGEISKAMRQVPHMVSENNVCLLLINQTREKLGVLYGDGATTYGGKAIKFYSSVRIELQYKTKIKDSKKRIIGAETWCTTVKNKLYPPWKKIMLPIYFDYGIDEAASVFHSLKELELMTNAGTWYTLKLEDEEHKFQKKQFPAFFDEHYDAIEDLLVENF